MAVLVLTVPFSSALRADALAACGQAAALSLILAVALFQWASGRAGKLTGRPRPGTTE